MSVSVIIATCYRKQRLLSTLGYLDRSTYPIDEVIIVDSGNDKPEPAELASFSRLQITVVHAERSVCIQRNVGIRMARSPLVLLLDDDIQIPPDYIDRLAGHLEAHPEAGAVSGLVLQKEGAVWTATYPISSSKMLLWNYIFGLSIWGEIETPEDNPIAKKISGYYRRKGNHITRAGWPVLTSFSGDYFTTPLYGLGASLIRRQWLLDSPYDERLDAHGIGDNYGVAMGFPGQRIDVLNTTQVYHHQETVNRLQKPLQYFRRVMALDYFIDSGKLKKVQRPWLLWSLIGQFLLFLRERNKTMTASAWKAMTAIAGGQNPYRSTGKPTLGKPWIWTVFILYTVILGIGCMRHELWGDELHSWNLAKGSGSFADLIANRRYEGHPPLWHFLLWTISKFTHDVRYMQVLQWSIAVAAVYILLFYSPIPSRTKMLIPFGYYFLWEYGVFSRNYMIAILLAFAICVVLRKKFRGWALAYYGLLFLLSNTHLLGVLLAASLHAYYLLLEKQRGKNYTWLAGHAALAMLVLLPSFFLILPPPESQTNVHALMHGAADRRFSTIYEMPIRAFLPIPAWWQEHFWNSQFLLYFKDSVAGAKTAYTLIAILLLLYVYGCLSLSRKSIALFTINLLSSFVLSIGIVSLLNARYSGFLFVGFLLAYWLLCSERPVRDRWINPVSILLAIQLAGGLFAFIQDLRRPFSHAAEVTDLLKEVPAGVPRVTDYWTMNTVVAYTDHPAYCIDMQRELSFILWGSDIAAMQKERHRYTDGLTPMFAQPGVRQIYMVTHAPMEALTRVDDRLAAGYQLTMIDSRTGAIDKGSDLYLYRITPKKQTP